MNTTLPNLYAELAMSHVQLDEDDYILDLILRQLNLITEGDNLAIALKKQRRDRLARDPTSRSYKTILRLFSG